MTSSSTKFTLAEGVPWIPYACCAFLGTLVKSRMQVFEFGSGGSTVYFARKNCHVISIEHDRVWFDAVQTRLQVEECTWIDLRFIPPGEECIGQDSSQPEHYYEPPCPGNYQEYASAIDRHPDQFFDIIMVDGTARPSCLQHAHTKLKRGGYLILDNSERQYYLQVVGDLFKSWERYTFWGCGPINLYMWECTIWRRP